jgi:RNA recognition motif-containing protein
VQQITQSIRKTVCANSDFSQTPFESICKNRPQVLPESKISKIYIFTLYKPYGEVVRVTVVRNEAGVAKGVAFIEFKRKDEADQCVVNSKELNLNGRPIFARTSLPQSNINEMKKQKDEIKTAKNDKRNLTLAREGEIREGTAAWTVSL